MRVSQQQRMSVSLDCNDSLARKQQAQQKKALDLRLVLSRLQSVLSRRFPPALLYRLRRGENPYDFSRPEVQRNYLNLQLNRWN